MTTDVDSIAFVVEGLRNPTKGGRALEDEWAYVRSREELVRGGQTSGSRSGDDRYRTTGHEI
jgi:hypothetical protein